MPKLLVIADDLTGAADTAAQFAKQGIDTLVLVDSTHAWPAAAAECEVLIVNTESRHLSAEDAADRVRKSVVTGATFGTTHYYKKTDSTLRGNIGSELEALRVAVGQPVLPYLPAYPRLGRTTTNGKLYVNGKLLEETTFSSDSLAPVHESHVPSIVANQTSTPCLLVNDFTLLDELEKEPRDGAFWLFDAASDQDLFEAGKLLKQSDMLVATAGSAGFAKYLAQLLDLDASQPEIPSANGPMLVVAGSLNEVTLAQLAYAERAGFESVTLSPTVLVTERGAQTTEGRRAIAEVLGHSQAGRDVIIRTVSSSGDASPYVEYARSRELATAEIHALISKNLAEVVAGVIERGEFTTLVILGGDTMLAIARELGWTSFVPRGEVVPGVAVSKVGGVPHALLVVSKAGGFGDTAVLTKIKEGLRHETK